MQGGQKDIKIKNKDNTKHGNRIEKKITKIGYHEYSGQNAVDALDQKRKEKNKIPLPLLVSDHQFLLSRYKR